eukprot:1159208-Pelagomonas_calceolata.AAC.3
MQHLMLLQHTATLHAQQLPLNPMQQQQQQQSLPFQSLSIASPAPSPAFSPSQTPSHPPQLRMHTRAHACLLPATPTDRPLPARLQLLVIPLLSITLQLAHNPSDLSLQAGSVLPSSQQDSFVVRDAPHSPLDQPLLSGAVTPCFPDIV